MRQIDQPQATARVQQRRGNRKSGGSGTALANIDILESAGSIPAKGTWGGARNSASRTCRNLTFANVQELTAAADFAEQIGFPFNRHWTVHYERAGILEANGAKFIRRLLKLAGDYARKRGGRLAAVWVRESGEHKGGHVHFLLHLPASIPLRGRTRRWVRLAGGRCRDGVSVIRSIGGLLITAENGGEHYALNVGIVRQYLLKGAASDVREALGLERFPGDQGEIVGKRCGTTRNIGFGARRDATLPNQTEAFAAQLRARTSL